VFVVKPDTAVILDFTEALKDRRLLSDHGKRRVYLVAWNLCLERRSLLRLKISRMSITKEELSFVQIVYRLENVCHSPYLGRVLSLEMITVLANSLALSQVVTTLIHGLIGFILPLCI
jgi:hypothetical protein